MLDTKSTLLVTALVLCIVFFAWSNAQSQSDQISTLRGMVQMFTSDRRHQMQWQSNPNAQPTQPAQPTQSVPMPSESGITPPLFKGVQPSGPLSSSVTIPSGVQPPPHMGERPHDAPQNGPFPPQQSSSFYIGAGMGPLEEHVPGDPTRELSQATNRVGHGTDDFGNPLPSYA